MLGLPLIWVDIDLPTIVTRPGESAQVTVLDGSELHIAGNSFVRIDDTDKSGRSVVVEQKHGLASYRVQHDQAREFIVRTPSAEVRVLGTTFEVFHEGHTEVTTLDGVVRVQSGSSFWDIGPAEFADLERNQQAIVDGDNTLVRPINAEARLAWERGRVIVKQASVQDVIDIFNRHNKIQLAMPSDPEAPITTVTGAFMLNKPEVFLEYLNKQLPINKETKRKNKNLPKRIPRVDE